MAHYQQIELALVKTFIVSIARCRLDLMISQISQPIHSQVQTIYNAGNYNKVKKVHAD